MSAGVGVWKNVLLKAAQTPARKAAVETPSPAISASASRPIVSLVRQIFFPAATIQRTQVLFAAADSETRIFAVCEQIGRALTELSGSAVAIAVASESSIPELKKAPRTTAGAEWWRSYSSQIADNLWQVPSRLVNRLHYQAKADHWTPAQMGGLPFDYVLFAASVTDSETPLFCSVCEGAVLVLTANQTRREAALRAKQYLTQCNAELLGTILEGRTFPVPEGIYRRL